MGLWLIKNLSYIRDMRFHKVSKRNMNVFWMKYCVLELNFAFGLVRKFYENV